MKNPKAHCISATTRFSNI